MNRRLLTAPLALALVLVPLGPLARGQQHLTETTEAVKIKAEVAKRANNKKDRVKIKLRNGSEVKGRITQTSETSFTLTDEKTGARTDIGYDDVSKLQGRGMSTAKKIGIAAAIGVGVLVIVVVVALKNFDPFENGITIR